MFLNPAPHTFHFPPTSFRVKSVPLPLKKEYFKLNFSVKLSDISRFDQIDPEVSGEIHEFN
ncbi:MAG: hypothetical protein V3V33_11805 [Candidatus Lokiarchaeia archaeon]